MQGAIGMLPMYVPSLVQAAVNATKRLRTRAKMALDFIFARLNVAVPEAEEWLSVNQRP